MSNLYFWDGRQVITSNAAYHSVVQDAALLMLPCVDTAWPDGPQRYGYFNNNGWVSGSYAQMPKEFLTHLLLLT